MFPSPSESKNVYKQDSCGLRRPAPGLNHANAMRAPAPIPMRIPVFLAIMVAFIGLTESVFAKDLGKTPEVIVTAPQRNFRTFLPKPGETIDDPAAQLVQVLLDRQEQGEFDSYMVQVVFRGKPPDRSFKVLEDRIEIDFYDTGKPNIRLSKIRGGAVEASLLEELFYNETVAKKNSTGTKGSKNVSTLRVKRMVRLTLYIHETIGDLKFRDTLDRTLIHFRLHESPATED